MATAELITATCEEPGCGGIIVYDPQRSAWHHHTDYRLGLDHAPRVRYGSVAPAVDVAGILAERDPELITESELRLMDGNR